MPFFLSKKTDMKEKIIRFSMILALSTFSFTTYSFASNDNGGCGSGTKSDPPSVCVAKGGR